MMNEEVRMQNSAFIILLSAFCLSDIYERNITNDNH